VITASAGSARPRSAGVVFTGLLGWGIGGLIVLLSACTAGGALLPTEVHPTEGTIAAVTVAVGDCVNAVDGDISLGLDVVPCSDPHDWEVYADLPVTGEAEGAGVAATDSAVAAAEAGCSAAFLQFLGLAAGDASVLGYTYLIVEDTAGIGPADRTVYCLIGDLDGQVSGSLAGVAR
jgi:hypothetical protein